MNSVLKISKVTRRNAQNALDEVCQCISDIESNLQDYREYIRQYPRAIGVTLVQSRRDDERRLLRKLRRRKTQCLRLLPAA
jgi:hypothetical protein